MGSLAREGLMKVLLTKVWWEWDAQTKVVKQPGMFQQQEFITKPKQPWLKGPYGENSVNKTPET